MFLLATTAFSTLIYGLFGGAKLMTVLFVIMGIDIVTGFLKAWKNHAIKSSFMTEGLFKKTGMIILVVLIGVLAIAIPSLGWLTVATVTFLMVNEAVSIIENLSLLGVKVPSFVTEKLQVLQEQAEEVSDKDKDLKEDVK